MESPHDTRSHHHPPYESAHISWFKKRHSGKPPMRMWTECSLFVIKWQNIDYIFKGMAPYYKVHVHFLKDWKWGRQLACRCSKLTKCISQHLILIKFDKSVQKKTKCKNYKILDSQSVSSQTILKLPWENKPQPRHWMCIENDSLHYYLNLKHFVLTHHIGLSTWSVTCVTCHILKADCQKSESRPNSTKRATWADLCVWYIVFPSAITMNYTSGFSTTKWQDFNVKQSFFVRLTVQLLQNRTI